MTDEWPLWVVVLKGKPVGYTVSDSKDLCRKKFGTQGWAGDMFDLQEAIILPCRIEVKP